MAHGQFDNQSADPGARIDILPKIAEGNGTPALQAGEQIHSPQVSRSLSRLAWLPIPLLVLAMVGLWVADVRVVWPLRPLYWLVHWGSAAIAITFIVIPAVRSFLANGQASILMLGCGVLMSEIGVIAMPIGFARSSDTAFAIYNTSILLSALCHFAGVTITSRRKIRLGHSATWLAAAYAGGMAGMALVIWLALTGRMPVFFIDGQGGTLLRSLVVSTAVALFLLTAGLLWQTNRRSASLFFYWYALGLVLLAAGLAGSMAIAVRDSPLQWVARSTQLFGMLYMCVAILGASRESSAQGIPLAAVEEAWREGALLAGLRNRPLLSWVLRYGAAVMAVAAATGLRLALEARFGPGLPPYITFYPAVMMVALLAGFGPCLLAMALAGVVAGYWFVPRAGQFAFTSPVDRLGLALFTGMGLLMSMVAELYRGYRDKAAAYDRDTALRESQARLATFAAASFEGIVESEAGRIVDCNEQFARMLGYSAMEMRGMEIAGLVAPEDRDRAMAGIRQGRESMNEHAMLRKDGTRIIVEAHGRPVSPLSARRHTAVRDITERKKAEDAKQRNEARLESLLRISQYHARSIQELLDLALDEAIALTGSKIGYIYQYDETKKEFTLNTWSKEVMKQCTIVDRQTVYQLEKTGIWGEAVRQARPIIVNDFAAPHPLKKGCPEGHAPLHKYMTVPILADGQIVGVVGVANKVTDYDSSDVRQLTLLMDSVWKITDRQQAEEALRESQERYHALFNTLREGFCIIEVLFDSDDRPIDFRFLEINPTFESQTGLHNAQGKLMRQLAPGHESHWFELYGKVAETGEPARFVSEAKALNRWYDVSAYRVGGPDSRNVAILFNDITDAKRAENQLTSARLSAEQARDAAEEATRAKDRFIAALSHELRTPLTPVLAAAGALVKDPRLPDEVREDLAMVQRNVGLEVQLIADLLDVTRIVSGKLVLDKRPVDAGRVLREAAAICAPDLDARNQTITIDTPDAPYVMEADEPRLHQVFWNLIRNAIKFTPVGGSAAIECHRSDEATKRRSDEGTEAASPSPSSLRAFVASSLLVVEVADTGCGIDPAALPKLFSAFEQGSPQVTKQFGGLGLGLAICKAVVDAHGGRISATSAGLGKGATFTVELPLAEVGSRQLAVGSSGPEQLPTANCQPPTCLRILLVEDHADTARIMTRLLMAEGHEVTAVDCVAAALGTAESGEFDVLMSDLGLPDGTGHDLMRQLLAAGKHLKGICLSGYGTATDIQKSLDAGFAQHLTKPINFDALHQALLRVASAGAD